MIGIASYGAYIPYYRVSRDEIAKTWEGGSQGGERAVANYDEDSVTMALEAAIDCLKGIERESVDGLFFATTTSPFKEKQGAALIANALDLRSDIFSADYASCLRAGTSAMRSAMDAVKAGSAKRVLVTSSDCRLASPQSTYEQDFGDGAGALLFSDDDVAVEIEGVYSISEDFYDFWRLEDDKFIRSWEDRFILTEGYQRVLPIAVAEALKRSNLAPKDFAKVVFYAPDARSHARMVRPLGFQPAQVQNPLFNVMGNTGTAFPLMQLVAALEEAKPGDRILLASYGDGSDVFILRATQQIENIRDRRGIKRHLASKKMLSYNKYLLFRGITPIEPIRLPPEQSSLPVSWRDRKSLISLHGSKCKRCGEVQYPVERVCPNCFSRDEFDEVRLYDKSGKLTSYSLDYALTITLDPPTVLSQVDFDGGGTIRTTMTDREVEAVKVDMPVEMCLRKMHQERGYISYYCKSRPRRG